MVYIGIKNGEAISRLDKQSMIEIDGATPALEVPDAEFNAAGGLVRLVGGEIVVGMTEAEKTEWEKEAQIAAIKGKLERVDAEAGAGRAARGLALRSAELAGLGGTGDYLRLKGYEDEAARLREELGLLAGAGNLSP